jgi:hypothetical protein
MKATQQIYLKPLEEAGWVNAVEDSMDHRRLLYRPSEALLKEEQPGLSWTIRTMPTAEDLKRDINLMGELSVRSTPNGSLMTLEDLLAAVLCQTACPVDDALATNETPELPNRPCESAWTLPLTPPLEEIDYTGWAS